MIHLVDHEPLGRGFFQQAFAKGVKRREHHGFSAVAHHSNDARFHLASGFVRERQPEDVFAGKIRVRFEQVPDAFGDDARFSRPRPRDDQQRPFAVLDRAALRVVQLRATIRRRRKRLHVKQRSHDRL